MSNPDRHPTGRDAALRAVAVRAGAGDRRAAERFVRRTRRDITRVFGGMHCHAVVDDLTQETYARAFTELPELSSVVPVRVWLLTLARQVAADYQRDVRAHPDTDPDIDLDQLPLLAPGEPGETVALRSLLVGLGPDQRLAFVLTQLVGLTYSEVALIAHCPIGTVRSRVARARQDITAQLTHTTTP
jgi:RNA polymerase sigma-70 factor (ECF subfamily)